MTVKLRILKTSQKEKSRCRKALGEQIVSGVGRHFKDAIKRARIEKEVKVIFSIIIYSFELDREGGEEGEGDDEIQLVVGIYLVTLVMRYIRKQNLVLGMYGISVTSFNIAIHNRFSRQICRKCLWNSREYFIETMVHNIEICYNSNTIS